jgi:hypothetical protein
LLFPFARTVSQSPLSDRETSVAIPFAKLTRPPPAMAAADAALLGGLEGGEDVTAKKKGIICPI